MHNLFQKCQICTVFLPERKNVWAGSYVKKRGHADKSAMNLTGTRIGNCSVQMLVVSHALSITKVPMN